MQLRAKTVESLLVHPVPVLCPHVGGGRATEGSRLGTYGKRVGATHKKRVMKESSHSDRENEKARRVAGSYVL